MTAAIPPTPYNIGALAHNALQATLAGLGEWMRLSDRVAVADAVVAAVEPLIRASERERIRELAEKVRAGYQQFEDWPTSDPGKCTVGSYEPFADLLREEA